jgi:hypothetical protein
MTAQGEEFLAWLDAAITRREETAKAASPGPWESTGIGDYGWTVSVRRRDGGLETDDSDQGRYDVEHVVLHDPQSVLRRCAADRKLLELHAGRGHSCPAYDYDGDLDEHAKFYNHEVCPVVLHLADGYGWTAGQTPPSEGDRVT